MHRLFDEEHPPAGCQAGEQVLRALIDEIPAEMGEYDQGERVLHAHLQGVHGYSCRIGGNGRVSVPAKRRQPAGR
jgi:hypothetical protein